MFQYPDLVPAKLGPLPVIRNRGGVACLVARVVRVVRVVHVRVARVVRVRVGMVLPLGEHLPDSVLEGEGGFLGGVWFVEHIGRRDVAGCQEVGDSFVRGESVREERLWRGRAGVCLMLAHRGARVEPERGGDWRRTGERAVVVSLLVRVKL